MMSATCRNLRKTRGEGIPRTGETPWIARTGVPDWIGYIC